MTKGTIYKITTQNFVVLSIKIEGSQWNNMPVSEESFTSHY